MLQNSTGQMITMVPSLVFSQSSMPSPTSSQVSSLFLMLLKKRTRLAVEKSFSEAYRILALGYAALNPTSSLALEILNAYEKLAPNVQDKGPMIQSISEIRTNYRYATPVRTRATELLHLNRELLLVFLAVVLPFSILMFCPLLSLPRQAMRMLQVQ